MLKMCRFKYILFLKQNTETYLTGVINDLNGQKLLEAVFFIAICRQLITAYPVLINTSLLTGLFNIQQHG